MGQAKQRGAYEERKAAAKPRVRISKVEIKAIARKLARDAVQKALRGEKPTLESVKKVVEGVEGEVAELLKPVAEKQAVQA